MKNVFQKITLNIIIVSILLVPLFVGAVSGTLENPIKSSTFGDLVKAILDTMITIGVPVAAFFFVYAGFTFVTSLGDPKKLDTAKTMFMWTVVGTVLIVGAKVIFSLIQSTVDAIKT